MPRPQPSSVAVRLSPHCGCASDPKPLPKNEYTENARGRLPFAGRPAHTDVATHSRFALETALLSSRQKHVQCEKARDLAAENSLAGAQPCNRHAAPTFDSMMRKHPMCKPHTARRWSSYQSQICRHATDAETGVFNKQRHRIAARLNRKRPPQTYEVRKKTRTKESGTSHNPSKTRHNKIHWL